MLDLTKLQPGEAERIAYAEGFTMAALLFERIDTLTAERDSLERELEALKDKVCELDSRLADFEDMHQ